MKSWRAQRFGRLEEVLELIDVPLPEPGPGQVVLRVRAAGVGLPDALMLGGGYPLVPQPPVSPGMEVVGDVHAVAADVDVVPGTRVMALAAAARGWGGFAEYCIAEAKNVLPAPGALSDEEAAGFYIPYKTAHMALVHRLALQPGEVMLVPGAAGSSGAAAVALGKALGASVIAIASSAEKAAFARDCGADHVLNHRTDDLPAQIARITGARGAQVLFDAVGGDLATGLVPSLARGARIGLVGFASGEWLRLDPQALVMRNLSALGIFAGDMTPDELHRTYAELTAMAVAGRIRVPVGQVFGFAHVPQAIAAVRDGRIPGKIIVRGY